MLVENNDAETTKCSVPRDARTVDACTDYRHVEVRAVHVSRRHGQAMDRPGEVLVEIGLEIKRRAGIRKLIIIALANDPIGYVCPSAAYEEGGYESGTGTNLAKGAGEIMVNQALELIDRVKSGG